MGWGYPCRIWWAYFAVPRQHTGTRCGTADIETDGIGVQYPCFGVCGGISAGVVGVILAVLFIRKTLAHKEDLELKEKDDVNKPYIVAFQVHNPAIFNKSIKEIGGLNSYPKFVISRLWRDGNVSIPTSERL